MNSERGLKKMYLITGTVMTILATWAGSRYSMCFLHGCRLAWWGKSCIGRPCGYGSGPSDAAHRIQEGNR